MARSPLRKASAFALIALFHVAVFSDVVMLQCMPLDGADGAAAVSEVSHDAAASRMAGMHHGMQHATGAAQQGDEEPAPPPSHECCDFCCANMRADVGSAPVWPLQPVGSSQTLMPEARSARPSSSTPHFHTLPNPPPLV